MRIVNLVIIFLTFITSLSLLYWHRKTTREAREKQNYRNEQRRHTAQGTRVPPGGGRIDQKKKRHQTHSHRHAQKGWRGPSSRWRPGPAKSRILYRPHRGQGGPKGLQCG